MNIFFIEKSPVDCAKSMVDRHVVKMILETCQLLSTAHRILDGQEITVKVKNRNVKRWVLNDSRENILYSATHINHPCAIWARQSNNNYNWLFAHFTALIDEYGHRYGKTHKCASLVSTLQYTPHNIPVHYLTSPPCAMDKQYIISDSVITNYRNYYKQGKSHLHKYTKRNPPKWLSEK